MSATDTQRGGETSSEQDREALLAIRDFSLAFDTFDGLYQAIDGVNIELSAGDALGIVGETGCGKSVTAKSILGLVPSPPARVRSGEIVFAGQDLLKAGERALRAIRGIDIAMIFQDPMTYLNPVFKVGTQLTDVILAHQRYRPRAQRIGKQRAREQAVELLRRVHLPNPQEQFHAYPHQLSGGMRQRVLIAMALSGSPRLLIADEPTTALDVTIQAQILELIDELVRDLGLTVILITHDLGVVAAVCKRVVVMYAGQVVEDADKAALFDNPTHPYTRGLLAAVPHPQETRSALRGIAGNLPDLYAPPSGCRFQTRCEFASEKCAERPALETVAPNHRVACWHKAHAQPSATSASGASDA